MLTDNQKSKARFDGGIEIVNRKRHLSQILTTLRGAAKDESLKADEASILYQAGGIIDRMVAGMERAIVESRAIKSGWDKHLADATQALGAIATPGVADVIALAELGGQLSFRHLIEEIERGGWTYISGGLKREAITQLAYNCAGDNRAPPEFVAATRAAMPAAAHKHAEMIRQITTLDVAQQLTAAQQPKAASYRG